MRNQAINATFDCFKKNPDSSQDKENTNSKCIRGGQETNVEQIQDILNQNSQNIQGSNLLEEDEFYGNNISTGQRTDSLLSQNNSNDSEENNEKNKKPNFIKKSDFIGIENKKEQKNSFTFGYYASSLDLIKNIEEREKEIREIRNIIDINKYKPYIPNKFRNKPQNIYQKNQNENSIHISEQNKDSKQFKNFDQNNIQVNEPNYSFFENPNNIRLNASNLRLNPGGINFRNNIHFSASNNQFNPYGINSDFDLSSLPIKLSKLIKTIPIDNKIAISIYKEIPGSFYKLVEYKTANNNLNENNIINNYYFHDVNEAYNFINEYIKKEGISIFNSDGIKK